MNTSNYRKIADLTLKAAILGAEERDNTSWVYTHEFDKGLCIFTMEHREEIYHLYYTDCEGILLRETRNKAGKTLHKHALQSSSGWKLVKIGQETVNNG